MSKNKRVVNLSDAAIRRAAIKPREYLLSDGVPNLFLRVRPNGTKNWLFIYRADGKQRRLGLGVYPNVSIATARQLAAKKHDMLARGVDPRDVRQAKKLAEKQEQITQKYTLNVLANEYFLHASRRRNWSAGHKKRQKALYSNHLAPFLGNSGPAEIKEVLVSQILSRIFDSGRGETAIRVRGVLRDIFEYACYKGILEHSDNFMRAGHNIGMLKKPRARSFAALDTYQNPEQFKQAIGKLMLTIKNYEGRQNVVYCLLNILPYLAQRPGQVRKMRWEQIDYENNVWICPPQIMKQKTELKSDPRTRPHLVPLPRQAINLLKMRPEFGAKRGFIFPGLGRNNRNISENSVNAALRSLGYCTKTEITAHGFRSIFQTAAMEFLGAKKEITEAQLAHVPAGHLADIYDRTTFINERKILMQDYADFLDSLADSYLAQTR